MEFDVKGLVINGLLRTAIGDLEIEWEDCEDKIFLGGYKGNSEPQNGQVNLLFELNHRSEDIRMRMVSAHTPEQAEELGEQLIRCAEYARSGKE